MVIEDVLIESNLSSSLSTFPKTLYLSATEVKSWGVGPKVV